MSYIGHTSEEVLQKVGEPLNVPWKPPSAITQENEDDVVAAVVNQRNAELEFLMKFDMDLTCVVFLNRFVHIIHLHMHEDI